MSRSFAVKNKCFPMMAKAGFTLLLVLLMTLTFSPKSGAQGPALTTVSGTVYRADGSAASGTVLISWPSFQTAEGDVVAAGDLSVTIGPGGAFTAQLVPNVGAAPAGTYYVAVFQLDDGTVRKEYWAVPATSPTTIAAVETTPGTGLGNTAATQQYVNAAVANRAMDNAVVHLAGPETITGTKQFAVPPGLPAPTGAGDAANKGYVDAAVANVGSGAYVAIAGGTMTGPLTLPGDPTAPNQAADRHYVDNGLSAKADLVNATVPTAELGSGVASSATCLTGNSTWGSCGAGAPAGITFATTALNWTQTISSSLTGGTQATVTLTPCPMGIDTTSGGGYQVLLSGGGNSEAVNVATAAGGCVSGAASGTITFTPFYSYGTGYTISSASSGLQETLNAACGTNALPAWGNNGGCNVTIPGVGPKHTLNTYNVYGTVFVHMNQSLIEGYGASISCLGRGPCLQIGDLTSSNDAPENTIKGLSFRAPLGPSTSSSYAGVNITATQRTGGYATITTATPHNFRPGDLVSVLFTDDAGYWGDARVTDCGSGTSSGACTSSSTTFRYADSGGAGALYSTPGVVALEYCAIVDNAMATHFIDIFYDNYNAVGKFNNFFDLWDDEQVVIDHFSNSTTGGLNGSATWAGSYVFSGGGHGGSVYPSAVMAPVITLKNSNIQGSNGVTEYNSNGLYIYDTVLQGTGLWQVYASSVKGGYSGVSIRNIYSESNLGMNPATSAKTPFPGTGIAGLIAGRESSVALNSVDGTPTYGVFQTGGSGSTLLAYFIVAHDGSSQTSPMEVLQWSSTGSDSPVVNWPRVANSTDTITYDVVRMGIPNTNYPLPSYGNCPGGSLTACGSVATGVAQCSGLVCSYTDAGVPNTSTYTVNPGTYTGALSFWPGSVVTESNSVQTSTDQSGVIGVGLSHNSYNNPAIIARQCTDGGQSSAGNFVVCESSFGSWVNQTAMLMPDGQVGQSYVLSKGRLNFTPTPSSTLAPHHIITLIDSNPGLTQATAGYRPAASGSDTWIGTDANANTPLTAGQLAFGSPVSITNYIAQTGDGVHPNWLERLSASLKEFNVPVKFDQSVTLAGLTNGCLNVVSGVIASTGTACGSGGGGGNVSSVFGRTGVIAAASGDYTVSQVTGAAADAAVVHNTGTETIAGAKTFTSNVTMSGNLLLPQGNGFVPAAGGIGVDTTAGLPVVNIGGTTHQVAFTSSNISGQAGTALALAAVPTQCSGSFATGIAANGNANCTTPNVIQLSETTQPTGIPNWGVFWFDAATHSPRVIDNNGQVVQLGLTNLFNSDPGGDPADNLEQRNGSNAQNLRVYSNYVNNTTWQRASLGYDTTDNYAVVRSENATSGSAAGLGLWIGSGLKWVVDSAGNFKAWADNAFNVGSDTGQAAKSIFAKTSFNSVLYGRNDFEIPNDGATGTVLNELAVFNTNSPSQAVVASTSSSNGVIGVVQGAAGKTGNAVITWRGYASCIFDNATTAGDAVVASTITAGDCHDTGSGAQPASQLIGYVDVTNSTAGQANGMRVSLQPPQGGGGGNVASVFGRTGAVTAGSGDYSVAQITGAAADAAVVHLAGVETISGPKTFSSDVTLSGNLNVAGNINQTGTGPTQWSGKKWTGTTVTVPSGMDYSLGIGSDNAFKCQLASGASCAPSAGSMVYPAAGVPNSTGTAWGTSYGTSGSGTTLALTASPVFTGSPTVPGYVPASTTINGHALTANVTISAADISTGTLPHGQLPALVSGDIPNNTANTSGTAAGLSGTPALPNGTTGTTQAAGDNSTKIATDALVFSLGCSNWMTRENGSGTYSFQTSNNKASIQGAVLNCPLSSTQVTYYVVGADNTANTYDIGLYNGSGSLLAHTGPTAGTTFAPTATTFKTLSWSGGSVYLVPGKYYLATTTSCTSACATMGAGNSASGFTFYNNTSVSVTAGGTLSALSTLNDSPSVAATIPAWWIH